MPYGYGFLAGGWQSELVQRSKAYPVDVPSASNGKQGMKNGEDGNTLASANAS